MIFYFTGTGNSLWVAKRLGEALNESLISIVDQCQSSRTDFSYHLADNEKVIFVYPIHSWGPPVIVQEFIARLSFSNYKDQNLFSVCTCGDDCGYTTEMLGAALKKRGYLLSGSYSVTMPNNYILFPGFDVDSKEGEQKKLTEASGRINEILFAMQGQKGKDLYVQGSLPFIKSRLINPLFVKYALGKNAFYVTEKCIGCGLCERICPTKTISLENERPVWANTCIQCVGCIHRCPTQAIEYGKVTLTKGRYHHPDFK